ncbi:hypothetical protein [Streptomyces sp. NPDC058755]|uniref:hypothetical protein n=1 Tax=unclassified Streptomyces TaxID=2593676 RepID=UPI0036A913A7
MYLVHLHLGPHPAGLELPEDTAQAVTDTAPPAAALRHVTVHASDEPAVGLYLAADGPQQAESTARLLWWSTVAARPRLGGWPLLGIRVTISLPTAR